MLAVAQNFIPVLTSEAGLCLTTENWEEVKVTAASFSVESLLYKPGQEILRKVADLSRYLVWSGDVVLNAMSFAANKEGSYVLRSPYDGSKIKLTFLALIELLQHLKPKAVILPKNSYHDFLSVWDKWSDVIRPFFHVADLEKQNPGKPHGIYFNELNWDQLERWSHIPRYITGSFDPKLIQDLRDQRIDFIETDEPAKAAMQGQVYSKKGLVDLTAEETRKQFVPIDAECVCPTCSQGFTRAYLHHLLQHTPLLCQRFLIQHNVFYVNSL